jgi:Patatin-like phospholipase
MREKSATVGVASRISLSSLSRLLRSFSLSGPSATLTVTFEEGIDMRTKLRHGAHGAFTWGVLDRLLEEPWLRIDGISGTSAGAMNAAVLVDGYAENGANGARAVLENFWQRVSRAALLSPLRRSRGRWTLAPTADWQAGRDLP